MEVEFKKMLVTLNYICFTMVLFYNNKDGHRQQQYGTLACQCSAIALKVPIPPNFYIFLSETIPYLNNFCEKILRFEQNVIFSPIFEVYIFAVHPRR